MYDVSAQGVDERMINAHYYYSNRSRLNKSYFKLLIANLSLLCLTCSFLEPK